MQSPNWNDLRDFLAVARSGQFARAALRLGVDPATIGRRLKRLERSVGYTLFELTREGQVLTEAGERLLAHVETMGMAADLIGDEPRNARGLSGLLRVSVSEGFGTWFVARYLPDFTNAHPNLTVELAATSGFRSPSRRETDVAVLLTRPHSGPVISGKLSDYNLGLYASTAYLGKQEAPTSRDDLASQHRLVGYIPELLYSPELRYLGDIDDRLFATVRSSSINAQHQLVAGGAGIGVLPCFIGDHDSSLKRILAEVEITRSFWIVTHRDTHQLQRVRAFRAWITQLVAQQRAILLGRCAGTRTA